MTESQLREAVDEISNVLLAADSHEDRSLILLRVMVIFVCVVADEDHSVADPIIDAFMDDVRKYVHAGLAALETKGSA